MTTAFLACTFAAIGGLPTANPPWPQEPPPAQGRQAAAAAEPSRLRGTVLLPDGGPAAGAEVEARRYPLLGTNSLDVENNRRPGMIVAAKCDARGCFAIDLPEGLPFELRVATGKTAREIISSVYAGETVAVQLRRPAHLEGVVTRAETGVPVAGATVRVRVGGLELWGGTTDGAGHWFAQNLMPDTITLEVLPQDAAPPDWQRLELVAGRTLRKDLAVQEGTTVRGRVVDARTKKPIAGAEVGDDWTFRRRVASDADGRYELKGAQHGEVHVRARGYGRQVLVRGGDPLDVEIEPGRPVRGTLVDAAGAPLPGIYVAATADERVDGEQQIDWVPAITGADGTFALDGVRRDLPHCLFVRGDGFATLVYDFPADEKEREAIDFGRIVVPRAVYLTGTVADEHGWPIANTPVSLAGTNADRRVFAGEDQAQATAGGRPRGGFYVNDRSTRTDSLGRFHLRDLAPGQYSLRARVDELEQRLVGSSSVEAEAVAVAVEPGATRVQHDFVIPLGRTLDGRVMTPSGAVPPSVAIEYRVDGAGDGHKPLLVWPGARFRLFRLPQGALSLEATPCDRSGRPRAVEGGPRAAWRHGVPTGVGPVPVCLEEDGWVQAFVVDRGGAPVAGARVAALDSDGREVAARQSDARGSAAFFVGQGGEVTLVAESPAGRSGVAARASGVKAGTSNVELVLR